jgi:hypothetical protein
MNTNWKKEIQKVMGDNDSFDNLVACTLTDIELVATFDDCSGGVRGKPFTLWTKTQVYFPVVCDGSEWVEYVSRDPDGEPTPHLGSY